MKRTLLLLSTAFLASGCASSDPVELNRLGTDATRCIVSAARTIDDGISPADTIAIGVMSKCQAEIDAYDEVRLPSGRGFNVYATAAWNNRNIGWMRQITSIVLEERAKKRR